MKHFLLTILLVGICLSCTKNEENSLVLPTEQQVDWANQEIGVIIHFDVPVFVPEYNWGNFDTCPDASVFNPTELNTDQWMETVSKLGAKYAVLVAKHCSGFSLWPTEAHPYSVKNSPWKDGKGDLVKDFIESCNKYGIKPGIYASTAANSYLHVSCGKVVENGPISQSEYNKIVEQQLTELWSNYGPLYEIWFDGGILSKEKGGPDLEPIVKKYQPNSIKFQGRPEYTNTIRWIQNERGYVPEDFSSVTNLMDYSDISDYSKDTTKLYWCPGEADFTLRWNESFQGGWFWKAGEDEKIFTVEELMDKYEKSVGRGTNMLLGVVIDSRGLIPEIDSARIVSFGERIKEQYSNPVASVLADDNSSELILNFDGQTQINRISLQEDIKFGERVQEYLLSAKVGDNWIELYKGKHIGHKRIIPFDSITPSAVKLEVVNSIGDPKLISMSAYKPL